MDAGDERWTAALDSVGAARGDRDGAFADLARRHCDPRRRYHTFDHASAVVDAVLSLHSSGDDWASVVLAAWYHDVVYDPTAAPGSNEGASAVVAERALTAMGATLRSVGEVCRLVCLTAGHQPARGDRNGALLCDADLSVLAADQEVYDAYAAGVRHEYAHLDDDVFTSGRRQVLRSFLDRPRIYGTLAASQRWEARARINISRELSAL